MARKISETVYDMLTEGKTGNPSIRDCVFRDNGLVKYKLYDTVIAQRKIGSTFVTVFIPHGWETATTTERINALLPSCVRVSRSKGVFTVLYEGKKLKGKKSIVYNLIDDKVVTIE